MMMGVALLHNSPVADCVGAVHTEECLGRLLLGHSTRGWKGMLPYVCPFCKQKKFFLDFNHGNTHGKNLGIPLNLRLTREFVISSNCGSIREHPLTTGGGD